MSYTPHTWQTGETVTAEKLNALEQGVASGGGGGGGFMLITVTYDETEDTFVADKTYAEIAAHLDSGGYCALVSSDELTHEYFNLCSYYEDDEVISFNQTLVFPDAGVAQSSLVFSSDGTIVKYDATYPES